MKTVLTTLFSLLVVMSTMGQGHVIFQDLELTRTEDKSVLYKTFTGDVTMEADASLTQHINIETGAGKVILRPSRDQRMTVEAQIYVSAKSMKAALNTLDEHLNLQLNKEGREIYLTSIFDYEENDGREPFGFFDSPGRKVDLVVYLPQEIPVSWNDRSGEIVVDGITNDLTLRDASGGIEIRDLTGNLNLIDHSGEVTIKDLNRGKPDEYVVEITDYSGGIFMENITGKTTINDTSGGINIEDHTGDLRVDDASGEIDISRVQGMLVIDDTSGGIEVRRLDGSIEVSDTSGGIYINQVTQDVYVKNDGSGDVTVRNVDGRVRGDIKRID